MAVHFVKPSDISFLTGVITPRGLYVLAAATKDRFVSHKSPSHRHCGTVCGTRNGDGRKGPELSLNSVLRWRRGSCLTGVVAIKYIRPVLFSMAVLSLALSGDMTGLPSQDVIAGIDRAQDDREQKLTGYAAKEHYTVRNSYFHQSAELDAKVVFHKANGKTYTILSRSGPALLQERVIGRILKEDARLSRSVARRHTLLTSANYSMELKGIQLLHGTRCYVIKILPRVQNFALIEGTAWFEVKGFSLLRVEGKPAASPSFWTGKPVVKREYAVVDGLSFPQHSQATSKGFVTGKSELTIDYSEYELLR